MWIVYALLSAFCAASTSFALKRTVVHGGAVLSTAVFRTVAGPLLLAPAAAGRAFARAGTVVPGGAGGAAGVFRGVAGLLRLALVAGVGAWPTRTPAYWRA